MTWTKISDDFTDDPRLLALSRDDRLLLIEATVYSNRVLSDGHVLTTTLRIFTDHPEPWAGMGRLTAAGLLAELYDGWEIVGFADHQRSRQQVEQTREATRRRLDNWRKAKTRNAVSNGVTNAVSNGASNALPDPTRPERRGGEVAAVAQARDAALPPASMKPLITAFGEFIGDDDNDDEHAYYACNRDKFIISVDYDQGDLVAVSLQIPDPPDGVPRNDADAARMAPHLQREFVVDVLPGGVARIEVGGDKIDHRVPQIVKFFRLILKRAGIAETGEAIQ